jgi:hypothetical protein
MLFDNQSATSFALPRSEDTSIEADITQAEEPADETRNYPTRLTDKEQRYVWELLKSNNFVGQVWPVYAWDDSKPLYEFLVDRDLVVQELNSVTYFPVTAQQLRTIVKRFAGEGTLKSRIDEFYAKRRDRRIAAQNPV